MSQRAALVRLLNRVALDGRDAGGRRSTLTGFGLDHFADDTSALQSLGSLGSLGPKGAPRQAPSTGPSSASGSELRDDLALLSRPRTTSTGPNRGTSPDLDRVSDRSKVELLIELSQQLHDHGGSLSNVARRLGDDDPIAGLLSSLPGDPDGLRDAIDWVAASTGPRVQWFQNRQRNAPARSFGEAAQELAQGVHQESGEIGRGSSHHYLRVECNAGLVRVNVDGQGQFGVLLDSVTTLDPEQAPRINGEMVTAEMVAHSPLLQPELWPQHHPFWTSMEPLDPESGAWPDEVADALRRAAKDGRIMHEKVGGTVDVPDLVPLIVLRFNNDGHRLRYHLIRDRVIVDEVAQREGRERGAAQPLVLDDGAIVVRQVPETGEIEVRITKYLLYGKSSPVDVRNRGQVVASMVTEWGWADVTTDLLVHGLFGDPAHQDQVTREEASSINA